MTSLSDKDFIDKYVSSTDVKDYIGKNKGIASQIKKLEQTAAAKRIKVTRLPAYNAVITRIKKSILASKTRDETGQSVTATGGTVGWQAIYGTTRCSGVVTYLDVPPTVKNERIDLIITLACHQVQSIDKLYIDGEEVVFGASPDARWSTGIIKKDGSLLTTNMNNRVFMSPNLGGVNQAANADLNGLSPTMWTSAHRQRGRASVYLILSWNEQIFPNGLPEIEFLVSGKLCYDPRLNSGAGGTAYTVNPALIAADYLMNTEYGLAVPQSRVDMIELAAAANNCDISTTLLDGTVENRFTVNGVIKASDSPQNVLETILSHFGGACVFSNGKYKIRAPEWRTPILTISEQDVLSDIKVTTGASRKDLFNRVRGTYSDRNNAYNDADFTPVVSEYYKQLDGGEAIYEDMQLPLCVSHSTAQRLAKLELEKSRAGLTVTFLSTLKAYKAEPTDNIYITNSRLGWTAKPFEVEECNLVMDQDASGAPRYAVEVTAKETSEGVFDLSTSETAKDVTPNTNLPNPFVVEPLTGVSLASGTAHLIKQSDGTIITRIQASWTAASDFFVSSGGEIHSQYKKSSDSVWAEGSIVPGSSTSLYIPDVQDGIRYDVRVAPRNALGTFGVSTSVLNYLVIGKTEKPSNVSGFRAEVLPYGIVLRWSAVPDVDVQEYEIKTGSLNDSWDNATYLDKTRALSYTANLRLNGAYKFMIKAVDTSGNRSEAESIVAVNIQLPEAPQATAILESEIVILNWTVPSATFAISEYEIRIGSPSDDNPIPTYAGSTLFSIIKGTRLRLKVDWIGTRYFWISARDVAGNLGTPFQLTLTINPASVSSIRADVVDNNVLLYWTVQQGSIPIAKAHVYAGATWGEAVKKGEVYGTFIGIFESVGGFYTYWIVIEDLAGFRSVQKAILVKVNQPPDFILNARGSVDPREAFTGTNYYIEDYGFTGSVISGGGGAGSPSGLLLAILKAS